MNTGIIKYSSSHEAIQQILTCVDGNTVAQKALQQLRTRIYKIIDNDKTPYKCRIYIEEMSFGYCIGDGGNELVINIMEEGCEYCWVETGMRWFEGYRSKQKNQIDKLPITYKENHRM